MMLEGTDSVERSDEMVGAGDGIEYTRFFARES